jgi:aspartyl-tRNA(Asn)/glutamyl-tRNA(Gln) amidotransferase subunit A
VPLEKLASFARTRIGGATLQRVLRKDLGIDLLARLPEALRGDVPLDTRPHPGRPPRTRERADLPVPEAPWGPTVAKLARAYERGETTPREVTARALAEAARLGEMTPPMGPMCDVDEQAALAEADASTKRWRERRPLGLLDGVPWVVKEQNAVRGLPRRAGAAYLPATPETRDATPVARMRAQGVITLGTTVMTEFGMTPNGANQKRVMPRNPHDTSCFAGGSSTGTGVAIATGLVPFGLGVDGGGSIRIPAAMNGVFGIKPTWGRVSRSGDISTGTVAHVGPLASSTLDLARALEVMSGPDGDDPQTFAAPRREEGSFLAALGGGVRGLVIGVPESEWADADESVQRAGRVALAALEKDGATLVPVRLELAKHAPALGVVIIASECRAAVQADWAKFASEMSPDLQITFSALDAFGALEYLDVARLRSGLRAEMARAFRAIDVLALPTTVSPAQPVSDTDMRTGFLDTRVIEGLCRFNFLGNLTGLPALAAPVGVSDSGLPVSLQLVGDAWDEGTLLAVSAHLERLGVAEARRPRVVTGLTA